MAVSAMNDDMTTFDFAQMNAPASLASRLAAVAADTATGVGLALEKFLTATVVLVVAGVLIAFGIEQAALDMERTAELRVLMASIGELLQPILSRLGVA